MSHHLMRVEHDAKNDVITAIATRAGRTLMFVRTKHGADRVAKNLSAAGIYAGVLHGGRSQSQRTRALESFRAADDAVLVATDVAARGIHVDGVSLVVHVDPAGEPKDYLHRSGRTARAGHSGVVVTLAMSSQEREVMRLLEAAGVRAERRDGTDEALRAVTGSRTALGIRPEPRPAPVNSTQERTRRPEQRRSQGGGRRPDAGRPQRSGAPSGRPRRPRPTSAPQH